MLLFYKDFSDFDFIISKLYLFNSSANSKTSECLLNDGDNIPLDFSDLLLGVED